MNKVVLDSSALLALLNGEPGGEKLTPQVLSAAAISAINLAEVHSKMVSRGIDPDRAWRATRSLVGEVVAFTPEHAKTTGDLVLQARALGLSLGDRACLTLASALHAPVYTADKTWKNLSVGVRVHLIR